MRWPWQVRTDRLEVSDRMIVKIERTADRLDRTAEAFERELAKLTSLASEGGCEGEQRGPHAVG